MPDDIPDPAAEAPAEPVRTPLKAARRAKPKPGQHGSGQASARGTAPPVALNSAPAPRPAPTSPTRAPHAAAAPAPEAEHGPTATFQPFQDNALGAAYPAVIPAARPPAKRSPKPKPPAKVRGPLSLEDAIAVSTALVVMRGPFTIMHIETTGPDPEQGEITAIRALRVDKGMPIAEFSALDQPLQRGRFAVLLEFLGNNREYVFAHDAAVTRAFLGLAARQHGMLIENPVGDLIDLAKLAWPDRSDYSLAGLVAAAPTRTPADATKAVLALLLAASKQLTAEGGLVSRSIVHWGTSPETFTIKPSPW